MAVKPSIKWGCTCDGAPTTAPDLRGIIQLRAIISLNGCAVGCSDVASREGAGAQPGVLEHACCIYAILHRPPFANIQGLNVQLQISHMIEVVASTMLPSCSLTAGAIAN